VANEQTALVEPVKEQVQVVVTGFPSGELPTAEKFADQPFLVVVGA
jgi:deoxyribose-phosphate aldolase